MTKSPTFWIAVSVLLYPPMIAIGCLVAIMPPLNLLLIPGWFFMMAGLVGTLTNNIAECRLREELAARAAKSSRGLARPSDERLVERALV